MIPVLYKTITEGVVPDDYGIGALTDCLTCEVTEERNGSYELTLSYSAQGIHAGDITPGYFIKAKPNFNDNPQIFQIYKVAKNMAGDITVNAQHISYILSGKVITSGTASNVSDACNLLQASAGSFTIATDKTGTADFTITEPSSVRSWFGGKEGSLLDVYGGGEWYYNNYQVILYKNRGRNRGVEIRYSKNLTDLSQEIEIENICTAVIPFYQDKSNNLLIIGAKIPTGLVSPITKDIAIDFTNECNIESATPVLTQLNSLAVDYISKNIFTRASSSITLDFVQLSTLEERVDLCDTVKIYFEALGISTELKCITTTWDVLRGRYTSVTFGDPKSNITDTIAGQQDQIAKNDGDIDELNQIVVDNEVRFYDFSNLEPFSFGSEIEAEIASIEFTSANLTTVKILHEFIFDLTEDLAKNSSYNIKYYLDDVLLPYGPFERLGAISQLSEGDLTAVSITRDFYYILRDVTPNIRHVWKVTMTAHEISNVSIDVNHIHVTLEGQKLYASEHFDGFIDVYDDLELFEFGHLDIMPLDEGTAPAISFNVIVVYLITEAGENLTTESGDKLIL